MIGGLSKIMRRYFFLFFLLLSLSGCSSLLFYPTRGMHYDPAKSGHVPEDVHFSSADSTPLHGWYFHHTATCAKKNSCPAKATLVFFHGNGENLSSHYLSLLWMLKHGYDFFIFDYRGYGRSGGEANSIPLAVADGQAALRWARARIGPEQPLVVFAQSLGGAIGAYATYAELSNVKPAAIVLDSTFSSYKKVGQKVLQRSFFTWPFQWLSYLVLSDAYASKNILDKLSPTPLLVIHGDKDRVVEFELGEKVFSLAQNPKEFWRIPDGQHTDVFFTAGGRYQKDFLNWLDRNLPKRQK